MTAESSGKSFSKDVIAAADTHRGKNTLTEDAACASYIRYQALEADPQTNWSWQKLWLKHCLSPRTKFVLLQMSKNEERINREADVNGILKSDFLSSDNLTKPERQHFREVIADWFLRRYNWKDAYSACYSIPTSRARNYYFVGFAIVIILLVVLSAALASGYSSQISRGSVWPQPVLLAGVAVVIVVVCAMLLAGRRRFLFMRLLATILVGLVLVVTGGSLWGLAVEMDPRMLGIVSSLIFAVDLAYCSADCARITSLGKRSALWRALPVTLWGILFAFVMTIAISCVMGAPMVESVRAEASVSYPGPLGTVYPAAVFLFAPVSLFIGLFMNSFWEEKPLTDPF